MDRFLQFLTIVLRKCSGAPYGVSQARLPLRTVAPARIYGTPDHLQL